MSFIKYEAINKKYQNKYALKDINIDIDRYEFVTIIGQSGSGKTTFLKMANFLIKPTSGKIFIDGDDITSIDEIKLRRNIGYAIQGNVLFPHLTVGENISYVYDLSHKDKKTSRQIAKKWLDIIDLDQSYIDKYPNQLSGGQQQRVGIARSLADEPKIVLMDEPFGAVDAITRSSLQDEIIKLHKDLKLTILFVTHDIKEAFKLATKVLIINEGKIEQYDSPENIQKSPNSKYVKELLEQYYE